MNPKPDDALTPAEQGCCHMNHWTGGGDLQQWRDEFAAIPRAEKCRDCPLAQESAR